MQQYLGWGGFCGVTSMWYEDIVNISLSTKNIKKQSKARYKFNSLIESLFHTFLHELYHLISLIESYLKSDKTSTFELFAKNEHNEIQYERELLIWQGIDSDEVDLYISKEKDADNYAFESLRLFVSLYEDDYLEDIPPHAFMAKIEKDQVNAELTDTQIPKNQNIIEMAQPAQTQ